jgi:hypothetical protein
MRQVAVTAIGVRLARRAAVVAGVGRLLVLVSVMTDMLRGRSGLVLAIETHPGPGELERKQKHQEHEHEPFHRREIVSATGHAGNRAVASMIVAMVHIRKVRMRMRERLVPVPMCVPRSRCDRLLVLVPVVHVVFMLVRMLD